MIWNQWFSLLNQKLLQRCLNYRITVTSVFPPYPGFKAAGLHHSQIIVTQTPNKAWRETLYVIWLLLQTALCDLLGGWDWLEPVPGSSCLLPTCCSENQCHPKHRSEKQHWFKACLRQAWLVWEIEVTQGCFPSPCPTEAISSTRHLSVSAGLWWERFSLNRQWTNLEIVLQS